MHILIILTKCNSNSLMSRHKLLCRMLSLHNTTLKVLNKSIIRINFLRTTRWPLIMSKRSRVWTCLRLGKCLVRAYLKLMEIKISKIRNWAPSRPWWLGNQLQRSRRCSKANKNLFKRKNFNRVKTLKAPGWVREEWIIIIYMKANYSKCIG